MTFRQEGDALREAQDDATIVTLREQEEIGLDLLTDGEQRREGFIFHMARTWDGIDLVNQAPKEIYRRRHQARVVPRITGRIARRAPATVEDVRFAKAHTARPIKMALAGPMTVIDSALNEAYKDEAELALDVAAAVNAELLDLQAAGCDMFQLDEPAMTRYHEKVFDYVSRSSSRAATTIRQSSSPIATSFSCSAALIPATRRCLRSTASSARSRARSSILIRRASCLRPIAA